MNLEVSNIESAKLGTVVANPDRLSCQGENILQQVGLDFVVNALYLKRQFPTRFEAWANAYDAGALNDHRSHVQIKRLIAVSIQFIRNLTVMGNTFRIYNDIGDNQILVRLAALARHLKFTAAFTSAPSIWLDGW